MMSLCPQSRERPFNELTGVDRPSQSSKQRPLVWKQKWRLDSSKQFQFYYSNRFSMRRVLILIITAPNFPRPGLASEHVVIAERSPFPHSSLLTLSLALSLFLLPYG